MNARRTLYLAVVIGHAAVAQTQNSALLFSCIFCCVADLENFTYRAKNNNGIVIPL